MPGLEVARAEPRANETISVFLRRAGWAGRDRQYGWRFKGDLPTIVTINGEPVLREDWRRRRIGSADVVRFISRPLGSGGGGGAKQVIGLLALVAVSAFAFGAPALLGLTAGSFAAIATTAAITVAGSLLVNALVAPKAGATNTPTSTQDQIYSVAATGNVAKLGQPLPVWYGRLKDYPDFAATPWSEFVANDQYLNVLLSPTMGSLEYEAVYVDDTILWDSVNGLSATFAGAEIAFYEPGAPVTLFPTNVDQSAEVSGQQLPSGGGFFGGAYMGGEAVSPGAWLGPFVANPAGTQAQAVALDFVFPAGCFTYNKDNGNIGYATVGVTAEYATCDDAGAQTGPFSTLFSITRSYASQSPIRDSVKTNLPAGRCLVRFRREDAELSGSSGANAVIWAGLRSFLKGNNSFADVSTIAIRLKASQSTQGAYKFGVLGTRKLPVWNGAAFVTQATRNPGWAFLDAAINAQYGSGVSVAKSDFNAIVNFAGGCDSRGDTFDYRFTTAVAVPDAFDKILGAARAKHFWLGDTISVVRDEWRDVPTMMLTDREIARDTTQVTFTMLGDEDPDAVVIEYVDENTWLPARVQYPPEGPTFASAYAETKRIDGIVNRDQAFREAAFLYLQSIYRRENVQLQTEYEGRAITFGSVVRVQSELPMAYGYGGAVTEVADRTLTLNPAPVWDSGPFYLRLRRPTGKSFGPVLCSEGGDSSLAVLDAASLAAAEAAQATTLAAVLAREDGGEDPSFELGTGVSQSRLCVVLSGAPSGDKCTLNLVVDDERVHATDLGSPPILPSWQFPANGKVPLIVALNARFGQGTAEPKLSASWFPAAGALYYIAEVSYDSGVSWAQCYEGVDNKFDAVVTLAALRLRVQAVGAVRGPYSAVDLEAPTIEISPGIVALNSLVAGIKYNITQLQDYKADEINNLIQQLASAVSDAVVRNPLDKQELRSQIQSRSDAAFAEISSVSQVLTDANSALGVRVDTVQTELGPGFSSVQTVVKSFTDRDGSLAQYKLDVAATFGTSFSTVSSVSTAVAGIGAQYSVTLNTNGYATGFSLINGGAGVSTFTIVADKFQIQLPGYNGSAPIPMMTVGTINGVAAVGLNGANMFLDGTLNARSIVAGSINTVQLAVNGVDITNLIAGAATAQASQPYSGAIIGGNVNNPSVTLNVKSGTATFWWIADSMSVSNSGAFNYATVYLKVDGATVRTWQFGVPQGGIQTVFTMCAEIQGLSSGNHTFSLDYAGGGLTMGSPQGSGMLRVQDLRR
ncbi:host specificity factor TipJ family phage tail protein [Bradyrhizobium sp. 2S1]|uniref:host specificity factor TipJ family phage tail protein n=1 Tax=Bradyrhizobium sp. 2S1 TaxID=1404429 RepID=UPI00140909BA|nr:host specificity factor TipJ family phage tail protein [Bradyrhizobium sp. 2S1]MCK7670158.1 host specificity factor TipJ family phage tail protein [Bradyrhizobium sp. 2S1]